MNRPELAAAFAEMGIFTGVVYTEPCGGPVIATPGAADPDVTITEMAVEVVDAPVFSTALAVTEYVPAATFDHVIPWRRRVRAYRGRPGEEVHAADRVT